MYCRTCCSKLAIDFDTQKVSSDIDKMCSYCGKDIEPRFKDSLEFVACLEMEIIKNKVRTKWQNYKDESDRLSKLYYRCVKALKDDDTSVEKKKAFFDKVAKAEVL